MANTIITEALLQRETQRLKDKKTIIKQIADTRYQGQLKQQGDTVSVQTFPDIFGTIGGTAGDDIEIRPWAIKKEQLTVKEVWKSGTDVKEIEEIRSNLALRSKISNRYAYASANHEDQFVASLVTQAPVENKIQNHNPLTLGVDNTYKAITTLKRVLSQQNAFNSGMLFVSPPMTQNIKLENILDNTDKGLAMRLNGQIGRLDGFNVMETNNLPHVAALNIVVQPSAAETIQISGRELKETGTGGYQDKLITFTFRAAGGAVAVGDIALGADLAATQQNVIDAINGTGTPGASTYFAFLASTGERTALKNGLVKIEQGLSDLTGLPKIGFPTGNKANVQSAVTLDTDETMAGVGNEWGVDAELMFATDRLAVNFVGQFDRFKITNAEKAFRYNVLQEKVYDGKIFDENGKGITSIEVTVPDLTI